MVNSEQHWLINNQPIARTAGFIILNGNGNNTRGAFSFFLPSLVMLTGGKPSSDESSCFISSVVCFKSLLNAIEAGCMPRPQHNIVFSKDVDRRLGIACHC